MHTEKVSANLTSLIRFGHLLLLNHLFAKSALRTLLIHRSYFGTIGNSIFLTLSLSPASRLSSMVLRLVKKEESSAAAENPTKRGKAEGKGGVKTEQPDKKEKPRQHDKNITNLQIVILKSVMRCFQDGRDLQSVVFDTGLAEATLNEVEAGLEESTSYNDQTHGVSGHGKGPPHLYVLGGFVDSLREQIQEKSRTDLTCKEPAEKLQSMCDYLEAATLLGKARFCPFFKLTRCYKKKGETQKMRITMSFGPSTEAQQARTLLIAVLELHSKVEFKVGRPPAGGLEREVQQWLETFLS